MKSYKDIIRRNKNDLFNLNHVVGVGFGQKQKRGKKTGEKAIVVLVDKKVPPRKLNNKDLVPQALEDYRTDVIEVGELRFLDLRTKRVRPAQPGVSIGHYKITAGTLGAVVKDKKTGDKMILSNNHVLANITNGSDGRAAIGDPILQPGVYDDGNNPDDIIARLERFIPIKRGSGKPNCSVAIAAEKVMNSLLHLVRPNYDLKFFKKEKANLVDCALARPVDQDKLDPEIIGIGKTKGTKEPEVGMSVQKSGRTTGVTRGEIVAVDVSVQVQISETETASFEDQFVTEPISKAGDSGSLVLDTENNAVGLLFAGSEKATVCNKIHNVFNALEVKL